MQPLDFLKEKTVIHHDWLQIHPVAFLGAYRALFAVRKDLESEKNVFPEEIAVIFNAFKVSPDKVPVVFIGDPPNKTNKGLMYENNNKFFDSAYLVERNCLLLPRTLTRLSANVHTHDQIWYPFVIQLLKDFSRYKSGIPFVFIGVAKRLSEHVSKGNHILLTRNIESWTPSQKAEYLININRFLSFKSINNL